MPVTAKQAEVELIKRGVLKIEDLQQKQVQLPTEQLVTQLQKQVPPEKVNAEEDPGLAVTDPVRAKAYNELIRRGYKREQLQMALAIQNKIDGPRYGRMAGATIGSLALPAALNLIPGFAALPEEAVTVPLALAKAARMSMPLVGAGLGGGTGEAIQTAIEEKRKINKREFLSAFGKEFLWEGGGRAFVYGGKFAFAPFIKREIPEAVKLIDDYAKAGGVFTPTQLDKRMSLSIAEEISRGSFGARQVFEDLGEKNAKAALVYADGILDNLVDNTTRLSSTELGQEFAKGITRPRGRVFQLLDDLFNPAYKELDELTESQTKRIFGNVSVPSGILDETGKPIMTTQRKVVGEKLTGVLSKGFEELEEFIPSGVKTRELKKFALKELQKNKELLKVGKKGNLLLTDEAEKEFRQILNLKEVVPHKRVRELRSRFLRDIRKFHRDMSQDEYIATQLEQITFNALTDPKQTVGLSEKGRRLYINLGNLWGASREGLKRTFPEEVAERLIKNPTNVTRELFNRNPVAIKNLRNSLIEPISGKRSKEGEKLFRQLRTAKLADMIELSTREGEIKPSIFESQLRTLGKEALDEMFYTPADKQQLKNITDLFNTISKKPSAGASLFIRGGQVGGAVMVYKGIREGDTMQVTAGSTLILGPLAFAKLAAHPLGSQLIRTGIGLKPGSTSLVPIAARLINLKRQIDKEEQSKNKAKQFKVEQNLKNIAKQTEIAAY